MAKSVILKISEKGARKTTEALKGVTKSVVTLGKAAGIATTGFGILSVKLAGDFQKGLLEVSTLMKDFNSNDLPTLSKELRGVAASSGLALNSLTKAKYDIVSAGFSNASQSAILLDASAKLAVGGVTSAASAADILTTSLNAFGLSANSATKVSDTLFTTVRLGKTTMDELGFSLGQVLPFAKSFNLSLEDVGAAMATLTASGINTAESTTALKAAIVSLSAPAESAKQAMELAGIEVKRFDDGTVDLVKTIAQFRGLDQETIKRFIPNIRAITSIQTLANNFNVLRDNVSAFGDESVGATQVAFERMIGSFNTQFAMLRNNFANIFIEIGDIIIESIQPAIERANEQLSELGDIGFENIAKEIGENSEFVFNVLVRTVDIAFSQIESRSKLMAMIIKNELASIIPFSKDSSKEIEEFAKSIEEQTKHQTEALKDTFAFAFDFIKEKAKERSQADIESEEAALSKKLEIREADTESFNELMANMVEAQIKRVFKQVRE